MSDPQLLAELKALVDPQTRGDPMSLLLWTTKSTRNLAATLTQSGHRVSDRTVAKMLRDLGFGLQANAKVTEGRQHEDRDAQFGYLAGQVAEHARDGQPVISVDTKKKELVGDFKNGGREYQPTGQPERVNVHDFPDKDLGKAIPYGIYNVLDTTGWVTVGTDHDTSAFAVAPLRTWWQTVGQDRYPTADRLLICADGGGSKLQPPPARHAATNPCCRFAGLNSARLTAIGPSSGVFQISLSICWGRRVRVGPW